MHIVLLILNCLSDSQCTIPLMTPTLVRVHCFLGAHHQMQTTLLGGVMLECLVQLDELLSEVVLV